MGYKILSNGILSSLIYPDGSWAGYGYTSERLESVSKISLVYRVNSRDLSGLITDAHLPDSLDKGLLQSKTPE